MSVVEPKESLLKPAVGASSLTNNAAAPLSWRVNALIAATKQ